MKTLNQLSSYRRIWTSGPLYIIEHICRKYVACGLCVSVTPTKFIYTGGEEDGAVIGLLNYPRFPSSDAELQAHAEKLANLLLEEAYQSSVLIEGPLLTSWITKRDD